MCLLLREIDLSIPYIFFFSKGLHLPTNKLSHLTTRCVSHSFNDEQEQVIILTARIVTVSESHLIQSIHHVKRILCSLTRTFHLESCSFFITVTVTGENAADCPALGQNIGSSCDDGNPNTTDDKVNGNCQCEGVMIPAGMITVNCPSNVEVELSAGISGTVITWPQPEATTTCINDAAPCTPFDIPGFTPLGEFEGSLYYLSHSTKNWKNAQQDCMAKGGQLAVIGSAAENQFIASKLGYYNAAFIGLTDQEIFQQGHCFFLPCVGFHGFP